MVLHGVDVVVVYGNISVSIVVSAQPSKHFKKLINALMLFRITLCTAEKLLALCKYVTLFNVYAGNFEGNAK